MGWLNGEFCLFSLSANRSHHAVRKPEPPRQMLQELLEVLRTAPAYFRDRCLQGSAAALLIERPTCSVRELSPTAWSSRLEDIVLYLISQSRHCR